MVEYAEYKPLTDRQETTDKLQQYTLLSNPSNRHFSEAIADIFCTQAEQHRKEFTPKPAGTPANEIIDEVSLIRPDRELILGYWPNEGPNLEPMSWLDLRYSEKTDDIVFMPDPTGEILCLKYQVDGDTYSPRDLDKNSRVAIMSDLFHGFIGIPTEANN